MTSAALNTRYPGRPDYTGPIQGWYLFIHHDRLCEWSDDITERLTVIDTDKPVYERAMRRHCLVWLEPERVPVTYKQAWQAYRQAGLAYGQAAQDAKQVRLLLYQQAGQIFYQAHEAEKEVLVALVNELVPDAPWNGTELVFPDPTPEGPRFGVPTLPHESR